MILLPSDPSCVTGPRTEHKSNHPIPFLTCAALGVDLSNTRHIARATDLSVPRLNLRTGGQ